ncbi:MAG: DNA mismatch repair protein MutS [Lachnospiraceae bacterium]|nr:DNA mismatch repair protein MutS [Lachnospiraceae bacterium]
MPLSPMMQHYMHMKEQYPDSLMFYRLGDFYEMFFDDAKTASRELELTLTGRDCGLEERAPMCGVPFHAADTYIAKLVEKGYKVAICEQVEDPREAKGMVRREVTRVVTAGTITDQAGLVENKNNYILCVFVSSRNAGIAAADISTGRCMVTETDSPEKLNDELNKFMPSELICNSEALLGWLESDMLREKMNIQVTELPERCFEDQACEDALCAQFNCSTSKGLGITDLKFGTAACGALFGYLFDTQKSHIGQITGITPYSVDDFMIIDSYTRRNLELTETIRDKSRRGSLLWVLDRSRTAMGARKLRGMMEQPLKDIKKINRRLDAVEALSAQPMLRDEAREYLGSVYDMERLLSRIANKTANPRDLLAFRSSLENLPFIKQILCNFDDELLKEICGDLDPLEDICSLVSSAIDDDPPLSLHDGGIIKAGYNEQVDHYRNAKSQGKQWLLELEQNEKERTQIPKLRIKYNRVFGYYIEVTNSFKDKVPEDYIRRQTLANAERYTMPRLKELESDILGAEEKLTVLEYNLFCDIRDTISEHIGRIQGTANAVAMLDALCSLSHVAMKNRYVRPSLNSRGVIDIKEGRHPVVEQLSGGEMFIPNDTYLDETSSIDVITGPNMAGKSTYMRQSALIVLMAQVGSFVPAKSADIGICDRIFTRVGASDDLSSGQSTFMVEMTEVANILRNATSRSLLILDEIGRGTSTFDGLSIAWSVIEYISENIKAKTLFATHYHELTELEGKITEVRNFCIAVKEQGDDIVFLRKIIRGGADKSYGIQVARLAGVPDKVLNRAKELVEQLLDADITETVKEIASNAPDAVREEAYEQLSLFDHSSDREIINELASADLTATTPIEALNMLYRLQNEIKTRS